MASTDRRRILERLQKGQLTIEETERLLDASSKGKTTPQHIYVQVLEGTKKKINVRMPFTLVRAGLKLGKSFDVLGTRIDQSSPMAQAAMAALKDVDVEVLLEKFRSGEITLPYHIVEISESQEGKPDTKVVVVLK